VQAAVASYFLPDELILMMEMVVANIRGNGWAVIYEMCKAQNKAVYSKELMTRHLLKEVYRWMPFFACGLFNDALLTIQFILCWMTRVMNWEGYRRKWL
jgi:hypothetical protein